MSYLDTLRRIPADIILAIAAQDFDEQRGSSCVCGWALRESIARSANVAPEEIQTGYAPYGCADRFGGDMEEWERLYYGACQSTRNVERAFVKRLDEIVLRGVA